MFFPIKIRVCQLPPTPHEAGVFVNETINLNQVTLITPHTMFDMAYYEIRLACGSCRNVLKEDLEEVLSNLSAAQGQITT